MVNNWGRGNKWKGTGRFNLDRKAAFDAGLKSFEGEPCPKGHTLRYSKTGVCIECNREKSIRFYYDTDYRSIRRLKLDWKRDQSNDKIHE